MSILFVLPAATVYELQGRACGWRATPASRDSLKQLRDLIPRLRELGATKVICSDLDSQSGKLIARRLNVPYEEWNSLRRFNAGKLHGVDKAHWENLYSEMQNTWQTNPDVPVKGGDSATSYKKRIEATKERIKKLEKGAVIVASEMSINSILNNVSPLARGRIYATTTKP